MKLNYKTTLLVGLAFCGISTFWGFYNYLVQFALQALGMNNSSIGWVLSLESLAALILLPIFGAISDKTNTKIGKRVPFVIVGTIMAMAGLVFFPAVFKFAYENPANNTWAFIALLVYMILCMCTFRSPAVSLMPTVTPKPLRSQANGIINLMGAFGSILFMVLPALLTVTKAVKDESGNVINQLAITLEQVGILPYITVGIVIVLLIAFLLTVKEPKLTAAAHKQMADSGIVDEEEKMSVNEKLPRDKVVSFILIIVSIFCLSFGNGVVQKMYGLFAVDALKIDSSSAALLMTVAQVLGLIGAIPAGIISLKIGRRKMIMFGLAGSFLCYGALLFTTNIALLYLIFAVMGLSQVSVIVNTLVIVVELSRGATVGKYTGYYYTCTMSAGIVAPIAAGYIADITKSYYPILPVAMVFIAGAIVAMYFVKHGDAKKILTDTATAK